MPDEVPTYDLVFDDLEHVVLEESYVLAIEVRDGAVEFFLDAVLTPGHDAYAPALPEEQYCYRRGTLVITGPERPRLRLSEAPPATDATGEEDLGNIDSMTRGDVGGRESWTLAGTWGDLVVVEPTIRFVLPDA